MNPAQAFYDAPTFGNVSLLHFTDCHGQLLPTAVEDEILILPRA